MQVTFSRKFDYTFASRAMVTYPDGWKGTVTREIGEAAVGTGAAKEATAKAASTKRRGRPRKAAAPAPTPTPTPPPVVVADPIPVVHVPDLRDEADSQ